MRYSMIGEYGIHTLKKEREKIWNLLQLLIFIWPNLR